MKERNPSSFHSTTNQGVYSIVNRVTHPLHLSTDVAFYVIPKSARISAMQNSIHKFDGHTCIKSQYVPVEGPDTYFSSYLHDSG